MKKLLLLSLSLAALLLTGCGARKSAEAETTIPIPTVPATTETVPETLPAMEDGIILADRVPAVLTFLPKGAELELVDEYDDDHYVVKTESGYGLVLKNLVRSQNTEAFEPWKGYAMWSMAVYDNFYLSGEGQSISTNTEVQVLEDLGSCYLVQVGDVTGFAQKNLVSQWPAGSGGGGGSYSGGGGGGGGGGGSTGQDGGDIQLSGNFSAVRLVDLVPQQGEATGKVLTRVDRTPVYLGYFHREDAVSIVLNPQGEHLEPGYETVYIKEMYVYVEKALLQSAQEDPYEQWDGFAGGQARAFDNFRLTGEPLKYLYTNAALHVLADLGDSYLVSMGEETFYVAKDQVSETQIPVYNGGSSGGGSSSGGGGGGPEWSDPIL